jgi:hypothetical protein
MGTTHALIQQRGTKKGTTQSFRDLLDLSGRQHPAMSHKWLRAANTPISRRQCETKDY